MQLKTAPESSLRARIFGPSGTPANDVHSAARNGQTEVILDLLDKGADIDSRSASNWTALQVAAAHDESEAVDSLLSHGAKIDLAKDNDLTALHLAAANGHFEIVKALLRPGADPRLKTLKENFTALHLAAVRGQEPVVEFLLEHTEDLEARAHYGMTALHCASREGHDICVSLLAQAGANVNTRAEPEDDTPLISAATSGNPSTILTLLHHGAEMDAVQRSGRTAVLAAAYFGDLDATRTLINEGASLDIMDSDGYTALRCAIQWGHPEVALALLQTRIRVNTSYTAHGDTALHMAVSRGYLEVAEQLMHQGADLHACDIDGDPPLQWAVEKGNEKMVKSLLRHGADVNKLNAKTGETVLQWAVVCGHVAVTELLLRCGADASLVDLSLAERREDAGEEGFETCKVLVETSETVEAPDALQLEDDSSQPTTGEDAVESTTSTKSTERSRASILAKKIRYQVLDIADQSGAEEMIALHSSQVEHHGVSCDGPLCKRSATSILGTRYKCTLCENVDFCTECVASFHNRHDARHAMVKCVLPTDFRVIRDIDVMAKEGLLRDCGPPWSKLDDLTHVVHAETQQDYVLQSCSSDENAAKTSVACLLSNEPKPTMFVITKSKSRHAVPQRREIIEYGDVDSKDAVAMYNIDEAGNVSVNIKSISTDSVEVREEELVMHHQDPDLMFRALTSQLRRYTYPDGIAMCRLANEGRLPTRLVDLQPGQYDDKLEVGLRLVDMAQAPSYEALSWTWKETEHERAHYASWTQEVDETFRKMAKFSHTAYCHEKDGSESFLVISAGLRDALRRLRDKSEAKTFWVDQLSINQNNHGERAFQVSGMRVFYNKSQQVTVWTGDQDESTKMVFDILRKLAEASRILEYLPGPDELLEDEILDLPASGSSEWSAVMSYFLRPVFGRCWVIQEIVVSQRVSLRCGDYSIGWEDVALAIKILLSASWHGVLPEGGYNREAFFGVSRSEVAKSDAPQRSIINTLPNVMIMIGIREDFHSLKKMSLEELLYMTGMFGATDPRDRIYSLLGIRSARIEPSHAEGLLPDYKKLVADVFIQATKACILESGTLSICGMHSSISDKMVKGLPSWVPDYSSTALSCATSFSRPEPRSPYSASGTSELMAVWPDEQRPNLLATSSCKVDSIAKVAQHSLSEDPQLGALIKEWTQMASQGSDYVTGEHVADAFWRTCVGDNTLSFRQSPAPESYHISLAIFFGSHFLEHVGPQEMSDESEEMETGVMLALQEHSNKLIGTLMADAFAAAPGWLETPLSSLGLDADAVPAFSGTCTNRIFFVSTNGYFGIGPRDAEIGDEIHILSGTRVPFVLRKANDGSPEEHVLVREDDADTPSYSMIGEIYVHGIMTGEALQRGDFDWDGIYLI